MDASKPAAITRRLRLGRRRDAGRTAHGGRMKSILDPSFHYTPAASTDLRKTFARVRREMRKQARHDTESSAKVSPIFDRAQRVAASRSR
jgi:hypothetical protein